MAFDQVTKSKGWYGALSAVPGFFSSALDLVAASTAINVLSLAVPLALMQVYDRIIPAKSEDTLIWLVIGAGVALILEGVIRGCRGIVSGWVGSRFEHLVGCEAVERVLNCRIDDFEKFGLGVHLDRLNAVGTLRGFYGGQVFQAMLDLPFAALFLGAIWMLAGPLVFVPLGAVGLFMLTVFIAKFRFEAARREQVTLNDRRFNFVIELLTGIHLLKAQAMEEQMLRRHERLQASSAEANMDVSRWGGLPASLGSGFSQIAVFGVVAMGGMAVINGELTMGGLAACTLLAGRSVQPVQSVANFWLRFSNAAIARSQLADLAKLERETPKGTPPLPNDIAGAIEFQNVSFGYRDDRPLVLEDVSLSIPARSTVGFLAASSSGTTTLSYLILGALQPSSGSVFIDDYELNKWDRSNLAGRIEYIAQNASIFNGTILDNISMFRPDKDGLALDVAQLLELDDMVALLPHGYETRVDAQSANFMPSGLIQRISIARAMVERPRIIIFDKTGASMDSESETVFEHLLERLHGVCTVVIISNSPRILATADAVYKLSDGFLQPVRNKEMAT